MLISGKSCKSSREVGPVEQVRSGLWCQGKCPAAEVTSCHAHFELLGLGDRAEAVSLPSDLVPGLWGPHLPPPSVSHIGLDRTCSLPCSLLAPAVVRVTEIQLSHEVSFRTRGPHTLVTKVGRGWNPWEGVAMGSWSGPRNGDVSRRSLLSALGCAERAPALAACSLRKANWDHPALS